MLTFHGPCWDGLISPLPPQNELPPTCERSGWTAAHPRKLPNREKFPPQPTIQDDELAGKVMSASSSLTGQSEARHSVCTLTAAAFIVTQTRKAMNHESAFLQQSVGGRGTRGPQHDECRGVRRLQQRRPRGHGGDHQPHHPRRTSGENGW